MFAQFQLRVDVPEFVYAELDNMIRPLEGFSHPTFCVLPFYAIEYPSKAACCLLRYPNNLDDIKIKMLQGQRPDECKACWSLEDAGLKSDRQLKNQTLDFYSDVDLEQLIEDCKQGKNKTIHYKIDTSNTCNSACVTCKGEFSSTWNKVLKKNKLPVSADWKILPDQTNEWIDYASAKSVTFRGGEPFLSDTNFYILEQLIVNDNLNCFISFVTNGSFSLSRRQKEILSKFPNLNFCFSIDGIGPVFEYLRWPLKWSNIEENIEWCRLQNIAVSISYTLSNVNLYYHAETIKWFQDHNINYLIASVQHPAHFRPQALPADVKQQLAQRSDGDAIQSWLTHSPTDDEQYKKFQKEIAKQDGMKNISIRDYLPELVALLKW